MDFNDPWFVLQKDDVTEVNNKVSRLAVDVERMHFYVSWLKDKHPNGNKLNDSFEQFLHVANDVIKSSG